MRSTPDPGHVSEPGRLPRAQRREQILVIATRVFADQGHAATGLEQIAAAAGVSRMILYRHFESKDDLYASALRRAAEQLAAATGDRLDEHTIRAMVTWAVDEPAGFDLLFRQAAREPEFRDETAAYTEELVAAVEESLSEELTDQRWAHWAARLSFTVAVEAVAAWLDIGAPDPEQAVRRIEATVDAVLAQAARPFE